MGHPVRSVWLWPWCCPPCGQLTTRRRVRQERRSARPFLRFPGKARLWEGRAGGGNRPPAPSRTGTLGNLFCASASTWGGLLPGMGRAPLPLVGLLPALWGSPGGDAGLAAVSKAGGPGPKAGRGDVRSPCPPPASPAWGGGGGGEGNVVL